MGNAQPTAAAHFERAVYTVASDGVLFAQYLSVDLRRLNTPRPFNAGRYADEYPTTGGVGLGRRRVEIVRARVSHVEPVVRVWKVRRGRVAVLGAQTARWGTVLRRLVNLWREGVRCEWRSVKMCV